VVARAETLKLETSPTTTRHRS